MSGVLQGVSLGFALAALPGAVELALLTLAALAPRRGVKGHAANGSGEAIDAPRRLAIVVPAHNEEAGIADCVASLRAAAAPACEVDLVVVADNCTDGTAERARAAGARVLERTDTTRRGKGYALGLGFEDVLKRGVDAVLIIDADSRVSANLLLAVHGAFSTGAQAVQARYDASEEPDAPAGRRLARLAFLGFNGIRPRGRSRLGLSAGLFGNGFALRRDVLAARSFGALSIVEDLEYHLELVERGVCVEFLEDARVEAPLPTTARGTHTQRTRWEGGRLRMAATRLPGLLPKVLRHPRLIEPVLDLMLLPLGLHVLLVLPALVFGPALGRGIAAGFLAVLAVHVLFAWVLGGARRRDLWALAAAPIYVLGKLARMPATLATARGGATWRRTERDQENP